MVIDDIIAYLQNKVDNDNDLPEIKVLETYQYGHKLKSTEIQVQFVQHSEFSRYTTFDGVQVSVCPLLLNIYATQHTIERTVDDEIITETISAQRMSYLLAQKVMEWLNYRDLIDNIADVIGATNANYIPGQPFDTGTLLYQSVVRVDLHLKNI